MTLSLVPNPFETYVDLAGKSLNGGSVYIGVENLDPQTNPQAVFWDEAGTIPAAQPIPVLGGYTMRLGTPANFYTNDRYSMRVLDRFGVQVFYVASAGPENAAALRQRISAQKTFIIDVTEAPYNAKGDGVTDDRAAILAADAVGPWMLPSGKTFRIGTSATFTKPFLRMPGSSLTVDGGATLTLQGHFEVLGGEQVFKGAGVVALEGDNRDVEALWFGGSNADVAPGIVKAWDSGARRIKLPSQPCGWTTPITLSTATGYRPLNIEVRGDVAIAPTITALTWQRTPTSNTGFILVIEGNGAQIYETGLGQTSIFISFKGKAVTAGMSISRVGTTATVTTPSPHNFTTGAVVEIQGADQTAYNGRFTCTVTGANTFTYTVSGSPATPATGSMCVSGLETANYNDSRLAVKDVEFRGMLRNLITERTGLGVDQVTTRFNSMFWESGRDTSFVSILRYLGVGNKTDLYYIDVTPNGLSNGLQLNEVYSILASGAGGVGGIFLQGIQQVMGHGNSIDICSSGSYALWMDRCTECDLNFVWTASDLVTSPTHRGAHILACFASDFRWESLSNQDVGVVVDKGVLTSQPKQSNSFGFGTLAGITNAGLVNFDTTGSNIQPGYRFLYKPSRTGANFEFYNAGGDYWWIGRGHMLTPSYALGFGANSIIDTPLFIP